MQGLGRRRAPAVGGQQGPPAVQRSATVPRCLGASRRLNRSPRPDWGTACATTALAAVLAMPGICGAARAGARVGDTGTAFGLSTALGGVPTRGTTDSMAGATRSGKALASAAGTTTRATGDATQATAIGAAPDAAAPGRTTPSKRAAALAAKLSPTPLRWPMTVTRSVAAECPADSTIAVCASSGQRARQFADFSSRTISW